MKQTALLSPPHAPPPAAVACRASWTCPADGYRRLLPSGGQRLEAQLRRPQGRELPPAVPPPLRRSGVRHGTRTGEGKRRRGTRESGSSDAPTGYRIRAPGTNLLGFHSPAFKIISNSRFLGQIRG